MDMGYDEKEHGAPTMSGPQEEMQECPICGMQLPAAAIEAHVETCLRSASGTEPQRQMETSFPSPSKEKVASPASKNLQQWSELQMHQLDNLLSDLSALKASEMESLEKALAQNVAKIQAAREAHAKTG